MFWICHQSDHARRTAKQQKQPNRKVPHPQRHVDICGLFDDRAELLDGRLSILLAAIAQKLQSWSFIEIKQESTNLFAPVQTILPLGKTKAVVLGSRMRIISAVNR
jgi:plasmid replication initiation protein